ncbi:glycosyltransferase family 2 protein [Thiothrix lacustris]|uniref:glycosyltransferase family 2 protein n=1 Tax=Thiothrix lacustris TaxID=525917 RepID=UPI0027E58C1A|nr:glycosyltransferase family A protein [Thiothrix lacustris]WMP19031.1 glycosyltransferase family A protein [Thiothrix lacustris]
MIIPQLAVLVATKNRPNLLAERALPAIINQSRCPDFLVVVDDSDPKYQQQNQQLLTIISLSQCQIIYLPNARTAGASGAWNTGLAHLLSLSQNPETLFIAIMDDDDHWQPEYLALCYEQVLSSSLDMVAADMLRISHLKQAPSTQAAPETLAVNDFLVGNTGIQGSNLFIRLSTLLAAGGFDEHLLSSTDRDLCIRLIDMGCVRYARLPQPLVHHFVEPDRLRLSTRGSTSKLSGLNAFWQKYLSRMSDQQRQDFCRRAKQLFDWQPAKTSEKRGAFTQNLASKKALLVVLELQEQKPELQLTLLKLITNCQDDTIICFNVLLIAENSSVEMQTLLTQAEQLIRSAGIGCFVYIAEHCSDSQTDNTQQLYRTYANQILVQYSGSQLWWLRSVHAIHAVPFLQSMETITNIEQLLQHLTANFIENSTITTSLTIQPSVTQWFHQQRLHSAKRRILDRYPLSELRFLGAGSEGIVFTDERLVYKCIDYWKTRLPSSKLEFLQSTLGQWQGLTGLYELQDIVADNFWIILTYSYEHSDIYQSGHEQSMISLLNSCSIAGIVCNNIHPKNLILVDSEIKLIDYGSDIHPWSPLGFEHMARRAYLSIKHGQHPDLSLLMREVLYHPDLPEMQGYAVFRAKLLVSAKLLTQTVRDPKLIEKPDFMPEPFTLIVAIISADPLMLAPLLRDLHTLTTCESLMCLQVLLLDNGCDEPALTWLVTSAQQMSLSLTVITQAKQQQDALDGAFGQQFRHRPLGQVEIAQARTMLQRYLALSLQKQSRAYGWILDDDVRVDERALNYLPWLPIFAEEGVDVIIGSFDGSSPNTAVNALRVHLVDLFHNLLWLNNLPYDSPLPDRSDENRKLRAQYPDYYYDLSRKHWGHLEMPHWLESITRNESVKDALTRLKTQAITLLTGFPLTRPIIIQIPDDPIKSAQNSVNRGGNTFILNALAVAETPNLTSQFSGQEARRSDMLWAIVNRHYRQMNIKAVAFPVHHLGRTKEIPEINWVKVQSEIAGSALYAALTEFLDDNPTRFLPLITQESAQIAQLTLKHKLQRLNHLQLSFYRIAGLGKALAHIDNKGEFNLLLNHIQHEFSQEKYATIKTSVMSQSTEHLCEFLSSLTFASDDYHQSGLQWQQTTDRFDQ